MMTADKKTRAIERFSKCVEDVGEHAIWIGRKHKNGVSGTFRMDGKAWLAHRAAYTLFEGEIPEGHFVISTCKHPFCVAPAHLTVRQPPTRQNTSQTTGVANGLV